jgi:hypothetical protein
MNKHIQKTATDKIQERHDHRGPVIVHGLEIGFVLDASSSMSGVAAQAIKGFNALLAEQKKIAGSAHFSLTLFNNKLEPVYDGIPLAEIGALSTETYRPAGGTALFDGIGTMIDTIAARTDQSSKVIIAILTDGAENSSQEYSLDQVAERIFTRRISYDWQFLFLSASPDALRTGINLRIAKSNIIDFTASPDGISVILAKLNAGLSAYRLGDKRYALKLRND